MTSDGYGISPTWPQMTAYVEGALDPIITEQRDLRSNLDGHNLWHRDQIEKAVQNSKTWRITVIGIIVAALGAMGTDIAVLLQLAKH